MNRASLLVPFLSFLLLLHDHADAADCEPATCGSLTIQYPFWLGGPSNSSSNSSCGHPAFQVWCINDGKVASLSGSAIHVLRTDYSSNSFVASHTRLADGNDGVCRTDFNMSSSMVLSPFRISRSNRVVCFLYGCNGTEPRRGDYVNATASCVKPIFAYLGWSYDQDSLPVIPTGNCTYTYIPVLGSAAPASLTAANYSRLFREGFQLEWEEAVAGECSGCEASGGQCRYNNVTAAFGCLCDDGRLHRPTCDGVESHLPSSPLVQ